MKLNLDPKKTASVLLQKAFGGKMAERSNFRAPSFGSQPPASLFGSPKNKSNFPMPDQEVQHYAEGGEVSAEIGEGHRVAAEEMLSAFAEKDADRLAMALSAFVEQCLAQESMESEVE